MSLTKAQLLQWVGLILIISLTVEVFLLANQNRELKKVLSGMSSDQQGLATGDQLEPFLFLTMDGSFSQFSYDDPSKKYLLFILSTSCPHCEQTLPIWNAITKVSSNKVNILGISIHDYEKTRKFANEKNVEFNIVSADTNFQRKYKVSGVPETLLVNGSGIVEKAWIGQLSNEQTDEIISLLAAP